MKKLNNQGFSLVELIIVIAIMAVLIGVLAPTYLGQVSRSKVSTDLQNAQTIATSIAVKAATKDSLAKTTGAGEGAGIVYKEVTFAGTADNVSDLAKPAIKVKPATGTYNWYYQYDGTTVKIGIGTSATGAVEVYPTANGDWAVED